MYCVGAFETMSVHDLEPEQTNFSHNVSFEEGSLQTRHLGVRSSKFSYTSWFVFYNKKRGVSSRSNFLNFIVNICEASPHRKQSSLVVWFSGITSCSHPQWIVSPRRSRVRAPVWPSVQACLNMKTFFLLTPSNDSQSRASVLNRETYVFSRAWRIERVHSFMLYILSATSRSCYSTCHV